MNRRIFSILSWGTIFVLAVLPRLFNLNNLPPALFADEVDAGYQAKFFNQNHTDYFGNYFPSHFHSFSDWRTPLYIYSIAIFQKLPLNQDIATRLPSALFGILSVYFFFKNTR